MPPIPQLQKKKLQNSIQTVIDYALENNIPGLERWEQWIEFLGDQGGMTAKELEGEQGFLFNTLRDLEPRKSTQESPITPPKSRHGSVKGVESATRQQLEYDEREAYAPTVDQSVRLSPSNKLCNALTRS